MQEKTYYIKVTSTDLKFLRKLTKDLIDENEITLNQCSYLSKLVGGILKRLKGE